jgi:uncharacterized membrane protein YfcA
MTKLKKLVQYLTQREGQLKCLKKVLVLLSILGVLFGSYVAKYFTKDFDTAWTYYASVLIFSFMLLFISLRQEVKSVISKTLYRIVLYTLINNFIDRYFGVTTWSWNDYLTVTMILIEYLFYKLRNGQNTKYR